jgi:phospholipid/cholesterol/gamma-HCH transport system substrate-binding protein
VFGNTFNLYANFKNISGLKAGNFVRFAGINVGTVQGIRIINDTTVRVDITLQNDIKTYMKSDAVANISSDGLMGDKLIMITPGTEAGHPLKEGERLASVDPAEMDKLMAKFSAIADDAQVLTSSLAGIAQKVNAGEGSLGRLVNSDNLAKQLESTVSTTRKTVSTINKTAESVNDNMQAAKHSFLLRGYFKKKEKKRIADSTRRAEVLKKSSGAEKKTSEQ